MCVCPSVGFVLILQNTRFDIRAGRVVVTLYTCIQEVPSTILAEITAILME